MGTRSDSCVKAVKKKLKKKKKKGNPYAICNSILKDTERIR